MKKLSWRWARPAHTAMCEQKHNRAAVQARSRVSTGGGANALAPHVSHTSGVSKAARSTPSTFQQHLGPRFHVCGRARDCWVSQGAAEVLRSKFVDDPQLPATLPCNTSVTSHARARRKRGSSLQRTICGRRHPPALSHSRAKSPSEPVFHAAHWGRHREHRFCPSASSLLRRGQTR